MAEQARFSKLFLSSTQKHLPLLPLRDALPHQLAGGSGAWGNKTFIWAPLCLVFISYTVITLVKSKDQIRDEPACVPRPGSAAHVSGLRCGRF